MDEWSHEVKLHKTRNEINRTTKVGEIAKKVQKNRLKSMGM